MTLALASAWSVLAAPTLSATAIHNSRVYEPAQLFDVYARQLGQPVTPATAGTIVAALRDRYQADGYARPACKVTDDGLRSGVVRVRVTDARLGAVNWIGDVGPYRQRLDALTDDLAAAPALRPRELKNFLRQVRQMPGLEIDASTRAATEDPGAITLTLDSSYQPVHGSVQLSNRGTQATGRHIAHASVVKNGLFGAESSGGLFVTSALEPDKYAGGGVFATVATGAGGQSVRIQANRSRLDIVTDDVRLQQTRDRFSVKATWPLLTKAQFASQVFAAFEIDQLDARQDGELTREDRLRGVVAGLSGQWRHGASQNVFSAQWELGIDALGSRLDNYANPDDPRSDNFVITRLRHIHLRPLRASWSVRADMYAQHAARVLPSVKRFKVGGGRIGRGFDAAALSGDQGIAAKVEVQRQLDAVQSTRLYGFYDIGAVWRNDQPGRESASSAGVGVSLGARQLSGYLELAKPLTRADADGRQDASVFGQLVWKFH